MSSTTHSQDASHAALSRFRRAVIEAERLNHGSTSLLEQAGPIVSLIGDAGLGHLRAEAQDLYRRAMQLKVRE